MDPDLPHSRNHWIIELVYLGRVRRPRASARGNSRGLKAAGYEFRRTRNMKMALSAGVVAIAAAAFGLNGLAQVAAQQGRGGASGGVATGTQQTGTQQGRGGTGQ